MDANTFKNLYVNQVMPGFVGPQMAAIVGVPQADGSGRKSIQMDIPGFKDDEFVGAVGIFGDQEITDPAQRAISEKYGAPPYAGVMKPARSQVGKQIPIPAHSTFNREATLKYMPRVMEGIGPGMMPGIRY